MWKGPVAQTLYTAIFTRQVAYPRNFFIARSSGKKKVCYCSLSSPLLTASLHFGTDLPLARARSWGVNPWGQTTKPVCARRRETLAPPLSLVPAPRWCTFVKEFEFALLN